MEAALRLCIQDAPGHATHIVCSARINYNRAKTLIDTGASSPFVSSNFIRAYKLPTHECVPKRCRMADGSVVLIDR